MLDRDGYRPNVGIILVNGRNEVFWGKRIREHSWQFPQGGIKRGETPEQAMFRELEEETGLMPEHVKVLGRTREWLRYEVPDQWVRREWRGHYRGQKQIWFLIKLVGRDTDVDLRASGHPEFDAWRWNDYWVPLDSVIEFKRDVYRLALNELSRLLVLGPAPTGRYPHQGSAIRMGLQSSAHANDVADSLRAEGLRADSLRADNAVDEGASATGDQTGDSAGELPK